MIDHNCLIGAYPYRHVPHPEAAALVRVLECERVCGAWVGHLPSAFHRDPTHGNAELGAATASHGDVLRPVPIARPDWPGWRRVLDDAADRAVPAVRAYPQLWGMGPDDPAMRALAGACAERELVLVLTTRFEDPRQRHPLDVASDLPAAAVRALARTVPGVRLLLTAAGREMIEEIHWGLTAAESERVRYDISWIWGPPEDHLAHLLRTVGPRRFVYGSHWPLRLAQGPRANIALLPQELRGAMIAAGP